MIGGMGQAAFVAFLVSLCRGFQRHPICAAVRARHAAEQRHRRDRGALVPVVGWPNFFVITCLSAVPG
jgi:hypothetical protein